MIPVGCTWQRDSFSLGESRYFFRNYLEGFHLDGPKWHLVVNREALVNEKVVVDERADQAEVNCDPRCP